MRCLYFSTCSQPIRPYCKHFYEKCREYQRLQTQEAERRERLRKLEYQSRQNKIDASFQSGTKGTERTGSADTRKGLAEGYPRGLDTFADTPEREGAEL
jgi:hypothetical protein